MLLALEDAERADDRRPPVSPSAALVGADLLALYFNARPCVGSMWPNGAVRRNARRDSANPALR
jgi:hypothetical protein